MLNEIRYDNVVHREYFFSGRTVGAERVRIFGAFFTPDDGEVKDCVLYIPDVDEKRSYEDVMSFVKIGFAVLMIDVYGKRDGVSNYTVYPESVLYANYEFRGRHMDFVDQSAKETCWYEWAAVARYALTFITELCPNVEKVGLIGVKTGANVGWQLAAADKRVKCAVLMFGAGWSAYKGIPKFSDGDVQMNDERRKYIAAVDAHAYAQYVECPVMFLTATNSEKYDFDRSLDTLSRISKGVDVYFNFAPGFNEYLDGYCKKDAELFMLKQFGRTATVFPSAPELTIEGDGNYLSLTLKYSTAIKVESAKVYINEGVLNPSLRNWNFCNFSKDLDDDKKLFEYVVNGGAQNAFAFAVVRYKNGVTLSSKLAYKKTDGTSGKRANLIFSSKDGLDGITFYDKNAENEKGIFVDDDRFIQLAKGANGIYGAYGHCGLISYKFSEPSCKADENSILKLDFFASEFCVVKLAFMVGSPTEGVVDYVYSFDLKSGDIWQNMTIKMGEFKSRDGMSIRDFDKIFALRIESNGKYAVNNILLI